MRGPAPAWALAALATLSVVATVAGQLLYPASSFDASAAAAFMAVVVSFAGVGAFLAFRVPANRIGWLLLLAGVTFAVQNRRVAQATARGRAMTSRTRGLRRPESVVMAAISLGLSVGISVMTDAVLLGGGPRYR